MKHHFVINPAAGKGKKIDALQNEINKICIERELDFEIYRTTEPCDATRYVKSCIGADSSMHRFYACGGDGTFNEVVNGACLADNAEVALIPIGTGNDFWRNFTNGESFTDIQKQIDGESVEIDAIAYNDRYCANILNIGFDCDVVKQTTKFKRRSWVPSKIAYVLGVVVCLFRKFGKKVRIVLDNGDTVERPILLAACANGQYYGGGYNAAPIAALNDGLLDLCVVEKVSRFKFLSLVSKYKAGKHLEIKNADKIITYTEQKHIKCFFDEETDFCVDGEIIRGKTLDISIVKNALKFSLPVGSKIIEKADRRSEAVPV